ncbi:MAG: YaiI/YqxD family protein [Syntrophobacteraceae bacterium]|nr:YaiI/YqxD family protein [Syntrophobacteraceae bacterium]
MTLWVDADACPGTIKELIIRAARRLKIMVVFVANKFIGLPESSYLSSRRIGVNPEAVDMHIAENALAGDIVVTQDIPLASTLVAKGVVVISTRGELFSEENIGERLSIRNFMQGLRDSGGITPGPREFAQKDGRRFADTLDRVLTRLLKPKPVQPPGSPGKE